MNCHGTRSRLAGGSLILLAAAFAAGCAPNSDPEGAHAGNPSRGDRVVRSAPVTREWFVHELTPADPSELNRFGWDVAISGSTAVVSSPATAGSSATPAAYVFVLDRNGWREQAKLEPPPDFAEKEFGTAVAISGDTIVVGAASIGGGTLPGAAYVYVRSETTWSAPLALAADDGGPNDAFGRAVAIEGDTAVVGAPYQSTGIAYWGGEGAAYVFTRSGSSWRQTRKLLASDGNTGNLFGQSLDISDDTILVGSPLAPEGNFQGAAYFFTRAGSDFNEEIVRLPEPYCCDEFGSSVALVGDMAVVGAWSHRGQEWSSGLGYRQGAAFVYTRSESGWTRHANWLFADDGLDFDGFGTSVALSGSTVMVGAPGSGGTQIGGADTVYLFSPLTSALVQDRIGSRGEIPFLGGSLDLDGQIGVVGTIVGWNGAYAVELRATDGSPCDSDLDCGTRHCVAGICCENACNGACEECSTGRCLAFAVGSPGTPSCEPYVCGDSGGECPMSCTAHSHCVDTHYCRDGGCVQRLPNGERCTEMRACQSGQCSNNECAGTLGIGAACLRAVDCGTGFCVDGFCCDQRCGEQCEACDLSGARGTCSPVSGAPRGERPSCEGIGTSCGGECDGEHSAGCAYPTSSKDCGSICNDGLQTDSTCNGQGACEDGEPHPCGGYACDPDGLACRTQCDDTSNCVAGYTCLDHSCEPGATCLDEWTAQGAEGTEECTPYRCDDGSCRTTCDGPDDCSDDTACDRNGRCVPLPPASPAAPDGGCSCRTASHDTSAPGLPLWIAAPLVVVARRRASRRRGVPRPPRNVRCRVAVPDGVSAQP